MKYFYLVFSYLLIITTLLPLIRNPHWVFRIFDFGKIQLFILQLLVLLLSLWYGDTLTVILLCGTTLLNGALLFKYTPLYNSGRKPPSASASVPITLLSLNVYQENRNYTKFLELVEAVNPDAVLTMESDTGWDEALKALDSSFPYSLKAPLDNTYGMHLFSKHKMLKGEIHYFVADDLPSMEAEFETEDGRIYKMYALHPPPPSPTEEETSKERDGDLLSVAKAIRKDKEVPTVAIGDFNCVAWAEASRLFVKTSELVDPRLGRGFISTFHAKYKLLRFPIDQVYHSPDIFVKDLKTLPNVDSDHLPLLFRFVIDHKKTSQDHLVETADTEDLQTVNEKIKEGKEENGER
jgi:endonuclease/exonuclease/phosphatase (EEP) superfamily protein YafD